jgi:hypothetical protein
MSEHSGKSAHTNAPGGRRGTRRRHAADQQESDAPRPGSRRKAAPAADSARPHIPARLAKAGLLAVVMALGAAVAAVAAPAGNGQAAAAPPAVNCALEVPDQPLTATGLATPYHLVSVDGTTCNEGNPNTAAFVQGMVLDPATGALSVYDPLVTDEGTSPAVAPVVPTLPPNAVVALWFGFNGNVLTLQGPGASSCVNGQPGSPFGQFAYCGAPAFFSAANAAIAAGKLTVPPPGTAADHQPCLTTRDFGLVDQDQSDNVTTIYLVLPDGRTAQDTHAAAAQLAGKSPQALANGSDNLLLDHFVDPALNCLPFTAPNLADNGTQATALGLNELQAAAYQQNPVALVPLSDPMVLDANGATDDAKTDLYRAGVDQPPLVQVPGSPTDYCANLSTVGVTRIELDHALTVPQTSPDTAAATDLFAFLAMRLQQSYTNLNCQQFLNLPNPVHLKMNGAGVITGATFDPVTLTSPSASPSGSGTTSASASPSPSASTVTSAPPSTTPAQPSSSPAQPSTPAATDTDDPPVTFTYTAPAPPAPPSSAPADVDNTQTAPANHVVPPVPSASVGVNVSVGASTNPAGGAAPPGGPAGSPKPSQAPPAGAAAGAGSGQQPGTDVAPSASSPVLVAGFEHTPAVVAADNPRSALAGPNPMANSGFSLTSSRMLWGAAGAFIALCLSLLLRVRPRRR